MIMKITKRQLRELISENVKEEQLGSDSIEKYETIGQALSALEDLKIKSRKDQLVQTGYKAIKGQLLGLADSIPALFKSINSTRKNQARNIDPALIIDYPILDLLDIHPIFFQVLDGKLMETIEDEYEKKHLTGLDPEKKVSSLKDINEYIQEYLQANYGITFSRTLPPASDYYTYDTRHTETPVPELPAAKGSVFDT